MKINSTTSNYINQPYGKLTGNDVNKNLKSEKPAGESLKDSISLSDRTKELQEISKAMDNNAADREKYVADIKLKVETGQYNMNAETVAEKMVGFLTDKLG